MDVPMQARSACANQAYYLGFSTTCDITNATFYSPTDPGALTHAILNPLVIFDPKCAAATEGRKKK